MGKIKNSCTLGKCKDCFYKIKHTREYMRKYMSKRRKELKSKGQLNLSLQEMLQFKESWHPRPTK